MNSYERRSFIAAVKRYWWVGDFRHFDVGVDIGPASFRDVTKS
jgi:hypothetical protein